MSKKRIKNDLLVITILIFLEIFTILFLGKMITLDIWGLATYWIAILILLSIFFVIAIVYSIMAIILRDIDN